MPLAPDRRLQLRIAGALALVVGLNAVLIAAIAWSGATVLSASGRSAIEPGLPAAVGTVLACAVGLVAVQARYGSRRAVSGLDLEDVDGGGDGPRNVASRVRRLATQADVPVPSVAVADRPEPGCLTVGRQRSPTIVLTTGLLEELDDDELEAALAHEIAHVANRDLPVVTAVAATVAIGDRLLERERLLRRVLENTVLIALVTGIGVVVFAVPILVLGVVYLAVSAVARTVLGANAIVLGLFSRTREYAADRGASRLTGNPAALASALEALGEGARPRTDARVDASATLGIVPRSLALEATADDGTDESWVERFFPSVSFELIGEPNRFERAVIGIGTRIHARLLAPAAAGARRLLGWRPATHPPATARIERLRTLERRRRE
ncbi:M48 family metallopeptidase [Natronococcus occultus]|uniref:Zn-dependent protease with chaperone function n=1 Tax=Natronococcus occultus SP4 TaxID=694430 RepID=L0JUH1_9EURY|nr:M48 family metalloprotease [Natronococcus occultus]AGB35925.1 Zn-dependent protease with chaperone function [Natronococcus occultus SP4]